MKICILSFILDPVAQLDTCLPAGREQQPSKLWSRKNDIKMFFVYVILSEAKSRRFYVGLTNDVEKRVKEHNSGKTKSTKAYVPWKIVHRESFDTRIAARTREKYLKSGVGKEWIKQNWLRSSAGYLPAGRQGATTF